MFVVQRKRKTKTKTKTRYRASRQGRRQRGTRIGQIIVMGKVKTELAKTKVDCAKIAGEIKCLKSEAGSLKEEMHSLENLLADVSDKVDSLKAEQEWAEEESNELGDRLTQEMNLLILLLKLLSLFKSFLLKILLVKSVALMRMEAEQKVEDQSEKCMSGFERMEDEEECTKLRDDYAKVAREKGDGVKEKAEKQKNIHLQEMPHEAAKREVETKLVDTLKEKECAKLRDDYAKAAREKDEAKEETELIKQKNIHLQEMLEAAKRKANDRREEQEKAKVKSDELLKRLEAVAVVLGVSDEDDDANKKKKKTTKKKKERESRLDWVVGRIEIGALRTQGNNNTWRGYCNLPPIFFITTALIVFLSTLSFLYA